MRQETNPPKVTDFPARPAAWFYFGPTAQLRKGPFGRRMLGRDLVGFRTASDRLAVLDARCSHLGANLSKGRVVGETIQCPFHLWAYACDGACHSALGAGHIPSFARQQSFPVQDLGGSLFIFNGAEALFPFPFFAGDLVAAKAFSFIADAEWFMVAAQGFDSQHFETVHDRRLLGPPLVDTPHPFARRNRWRAEIVGTSIRDRVLKALVGSEVSLTIENWGGTMMLVQAQFNRACSRFMVSLEPLPDRRTAIHVLTFAPRGVAQFFLPLRRWFTRAHLESEAEQIRQTEYRPGRFVEGDTAMVECFQWLAALPQTTNPTMEHA